jgi:hypothetical protein
MEDDDLDFSPPPWKRKKKIPKVQPENGTVPSGTGNQLKKPIASMKNKNDIDKETVSVDQALVFEPVFLQRNSENHCIHGCSDNFAKQQPKFSLANPDFQNRRPPKKNVVSFSDEDFQSPLKKIRPHLGDHSPVIKAAIPYERSLAFCLLFDWFLLCSCNPAE